MAQNQSKKREEEEASHDDPLILVYLDEWSKRVFNSIVFHEDLLLKNELGLYFWYSKEILLGLTCVAFMDTTEFLVCP